MGKSLSEIADILYRKNVNYRTHFVDPDEPNPNGGEEPPKFSVAAPNSELAPQAKETAPAASTSDSPNASPAKETEPANSGAQKTPANLKSERKSSEVALTDSVDPSEKEQEGEKDALKAGERTRGGRFVSKPAYNMDSFHATVETASTDRVINVTRAKAPVLDASYSR